MKPNIHPKYFHDAKVFVGGKLVGTVGSTKPELHLDVWSGTHPFYTGEQRIIDTAGQVERFMRRLEVGVKQRDVQSQQVIDRKEQERDAKRQRRGLTPLQKKAADAEDASEG